MQLFPTAKKIPPAAAVIVGSGGFRVGDGTGKTTFYPTAQPPDFASVAVARKAEDYEAASTQAQQARAPFAWNKMHAYPAAAAFDRARDPTVTGLFTTIHFAIPQ